MHLASMPLICQSSCYSLHKCSVLALPVDSQMVSTHNAESIAMLGNQQVTPQPQNTKWTTYITADNTYYHHLFGFLADVAHCRQCLALVTTAHLPHTFLPQSLHASEHLSSGPSSSISTSMSFASFSSRVSQSSHRGAFASWW
jgi:hypothetical protein